MAAIRKILYPTDFSERSLAALPLAVDLAQRYDAELHCLHVVDMPSEFVLEDSYMLPLTTEYRPDYDKLKEVAESHLEQFVTEHMPDLRDSVKRAVIMGKPFAEILRYAREQGIDLIVLGTHGRSALGSMLLGSVAEKVVRKATCAVLTVRHPEHRYEAP
jgi:nucleotide-binding universal stress UspA family protein